MECLAPMSPAPGLDGFATDSKTDLLLVEDDSAHAALLQRAFGKVPEFCLHVAGDLDAAFAALKTLKPALVLCDLCLPDGEGTRLLPKAQDELGDYPVVIMTSHGDESKAVEAMKAGALDYVVKTDRALADMPRIVTRALREWQLANNQHRIEQEVRHRERELTQGDKMEAMGRLVGGLAHEFNNALMGIVGCADIALSKLATGGDPHRYIEALKTAALSSASSVRELLAFSSRDTHAGTIQLDQTLEATIGKAQRLAGSAVSVVAELGATGARVRTSPGELEHVVMHLCTNALDAMPEGGRLHLRTRLITLDAAAAAQLPPLGAGRHVLLSVSDTGIGMDELTESNAFEPFFTTKGYLGAGLGLSSVYGTVTRAGGRTELESTPGRGTEVRLYFPEIEGEPAGELDDASPNGRSVLVVEDDPLVRLAVRHYLEQADYGVWEAADANEALGLIAGHQRAFDLLLTDVALPGLSGPELARQAQGISPDLPVVFMSGHAQQVLGPNGGLTSTPHLLSKPFTREQLLAVVLASLTSSSLSG